MAVEDNVESAVERVHEAACTWCREQVAAKGEPLPDQRSRWGDNADWRFLDVGAGDLASAYRWRWECALERVLEEGSW